MPAPTVKAKVTVFARTARHGPEGTRTLTRISPAHGPVHRESRSRRTALTVGEGRPERVPVDVHSKLIE